jgi:DNA-binding NtrC family response regulator
MVEPLVFVVVTDIMQRDLIVMALKRNHFNPFICNNLVELPSLIEEMKPSVLLLDIYLSGGNGLDLVLDLKERGLLEQTKVIGISSMAFPEIVRKLAQAGFSDLLVKPLDIDLMVRRVRRALHH